MRYYRVSISGWGMETVYGKLTEAQYEFWKDLEESDIISHAFSDPWEESDENPVYDPDDSRFLGDWNELDDYLHEYGADAGGCYITIEEFDGPNPPHGSLKEIVDGVDWEVFVKKYKPIVTEVDETDCLADAEYVFCGQSSEKGSFGDYSIETKDELDISKLDFAVTETPDGSILQLLSYNNEDVDNEGGDTTGKGFYASIWEE